MRTFSSLEELEAALGEEIGPTEWLTVAQDRIDTFAEATGDHQWIHVDPERAAQGPFGRTVAHGYLTLSLVPLFATQLFDVATPGAKLNYGVNKVRFPSPVPVDARVRCRVTMTEATPGPVGTQVVMRYVVELEGADKPACVAETVVLFLPS